MLGIPRRTWLWTLKGSQSSYTVSAMSWGYFMSCSSLLVSWSMQPCLWFQNLGWLFLIVFFWLDLGALPSGHTFGFSAPLMDIRIKIKFFLFPVFPFLGSPSRGKIFNRCPESRKIAGLALTPSHFEYVCLNSLHLLIVKPSWLFSLCRSFAPFSLFGIMYYSLSFASFTSTAQRG